jgi:methyl-accepting chemotaxis protein
MTTKKLLADFSRWYSALDSVQANIFMADQNFTLIYMNPKAEKTLKNIENEIFEVFGVRFDSFIGESIHKFHRDPKRVESILRNPSALPHEAIFDFGEVQLKTSINGVPGPEGEIFGYIVNWEDMSEKVRLDKEMEKLSIELENIEDRESWLDG